MRKFSFGLLLAGCVFGTQAFAVGTSNNIYPVSIYVDNNTSLPITVINSNYSVNKVTLTAPTVPAKSRVLVGTVEPAQDGSISVAFIDHIGNDPMCYYNAPMATLTRSATNLPFSLPAGCDASIEPNKGSFNGFSYHVSAGCNRSIKTPEFDMNFTETLSK